MSLTNDLVGSTPSGLLNRAAELACVEQAELRRRWIAVSHKTGFLKLIQNQSDSIIDLVLRSMEDETARRAKANYHPVDLHLNLQVTLSRFWIFSWYEAVRGAQEKIGKAPRVVALRKKLELVRVPLAKLDIAHGSKIKNPVYFVKTVGCPRIRSLTLGENRSNTSRPCFLAASRDPAGGASTINQQNATLTYFAAT